MAHLVPAKFADLVSRLYQEPAKQGTLFALPRKKWYLLDANTPNLGVQFHGRRAGNPSGPAAGPQTQMAQNILLSYVAGGRILELKTVQINDRLTIPRPCIDVTNIGYNVEWSQELSLEQSLREYVAGMMLVEIFRRDERLGGSTLAGPHGDVIYDMSVGYDLAGIKSGRVQRFLDGMRNARAIIDELRAEIPSTYSSRELDFQSQISGCVTLSTFHGCPAEEIERICEFLLNERGIDVVVKMNPPMLGKERLEHLLHDVLGYTELTVNPSAYTSGLQFDEALELVKRLKAVAAHRGLGFGCKFSNTLEVLNHRSFFTPDNKVQYLSGQPLHVITMALTEVFRRATGPELPISFSAGIDRHNFAAAVACGFTPVTVCTDLLRPGGYGRLPPYLHDLGNAMIKCGAGTIDEFILDAFGHRDKADHLADPEGASAVRWASLLNTTTAAQRAQDDPRYRAAQNRKIPNRIDSHLTTFDCITCDKCIPVCPNAANFTYPTPKVAFDYFDLIVNSSGHRFDNERRHFEIDQSMQIANYAEFCNDCGNCDTFCPEYGGPYIKKPAFYSSEETWLAAAPRDGFFVRKGDGISAIQSRILGARYELEHDTQSETFVFRDDQISLTLCAKDHHPIRSSLSAGSPIEHRVNMNIYHTLRYLLSGALNSDVVHQANVGNPGPFIGLRHNI